MKDLKILKNKRWLLPIIGLILAIIIPTAFAFYYKNINSPLTTKFSIEDIDEVFIRAYIITYWEKSETGEIVAKSSWPLKENIHTSNWTKIDDYYYYYNGTITKENIDNNTPVNYALIADDTKITDLTDADLTNAIYVARYKIIYEYMEATERNGILSSEDAWGITYSDTGVPSKIG